MPSPLMHSKVIIPEHLPGEPKRGRAPAPLFAIMLLVFGLTVMFTWLLTAVLWPLYLLFSAIWGWPANVPPRWQVRRYLVLCWTVRPTPSLPLLNRFWLTLSILRNCAFIPVRGLAWLIDEALYGRLFNKNPLVEPLIEISAGRSGSTQLAYYLQEDPHLAAPNPLQMRFPYLWLWRLASRTLGRLVSSDRLREKAEANLLPEFVQRHEIDPTKTDTFEGCFYATHMNAFAPFLGPRVIEDDLGMARPSLRNLELWEQDFVAMLDRIGRKTLLFAGPGPEGNPRRFFVKGHFLCAGPALERAFPDARFLTMIRDPGPRIRSVINYMRCFPFDLSIHPMPWLWWAEAMVQTETDYCEVEQQWFEQEGGATRCVLRFSDYVRNLEGTMAKVYRECLDCSELPDYVPREHVPRNRNDYLVNRTLEQLGIDEEALNANLSGYIAWCRCE